MKILILTLLLISCGKKNTSNQQLPLSLLQEQKTAEDPTRDSDYDGITDTEEKLMGTDPFIADFPKVHFKMESDLNLRSNFYLFSDESTHKYPLQFSKNIDRNKHFILKIIRNLAYEELTGRELNFNVNHLTNLNLYPLKCLTAAQRKGQLKSLLERKRELKPQGYSFDYSFRSNIQKIKNLVSLGKVKKAYYLNDSVLGKSISSRTYYNFDETRFDYAQLQKETFEDEGELNKSNFNPYGNCISVKVTDFDYVVGKKQLKYKKQFEQVEQKLAHVVVYNGKKLIKLSVNPAYYNVEKILKKLNAKAKFGYDGEVVKAFGNGNEFIDLHNLDLLDQRDLDKQRWFYFNKKNLRPIEKLISGEVYFLALLSVKEILKVKKYEEKITADHSKSLVLQNVLPNDQITITQTLNASFNLPAVKKYLTKGYLSLPFNNVADDFPRACSVHEYNTYPSGVPQSFKLDKASSFPLFVKKRQIFPKIVHDKLVYEFTISLEDITEGDLHMTFKEVTGEILSYRRNTHKVDHGDGTCRPRKKTNSTTYTTHSVHRKIKYNIEIVRRGIHR